MISPAKSSNAKWGFKWSTVALHKEAPGETGEDTLLHKISKDFWADNVLEFKKKEVMYHCCRHTQGLRIIIKTEAIL